MDNILKRISYYTRKVAERGSIHLSQKPPRAYTYRHERLMAYKTELNKRIEQQKGMKEMGKVRAIGEIRFVVCRNEDCRADGMELVELANRIHEMLVDMNKLNLTMIDGSKEDVEVLDVHIEWEEAFNQDGTHHSWFEDVDGVKHLVRAKDSKKRAVKN